MVVTDAEDTKGGADDRLARKRKRDKIIFFTVVAVVILVIAGSTAGYFVAKRMNRTDDDNGDLKETGEYVQIPLSDVSSDSDLHFYSYNSGGVDIGFMVINNTKGDIHCAFDACINTTPKEPGSPTCWEAHMGYRQSGYYLQCKYKECTYPLNSIGSGWPGCCVPPDLAYSRDGEYINIKKSDLEAGKYYFTTDGPSE